jgi:hypothetical protein
MQCPVCASQAKNLTPNTSEGVVIGCGHCGDYRIAGSAFYTLTTLKPDMRLAALASAKRASQAGWPIINSSCITTSSGTAYRTRAGGTGGIPAHQPPQLARRLFDLC